MNFSFIRPRGAFIHGIGVETPGAVKYMEIFDKSSDIITAGSGSKSKNKKAKGKIRKGAMMGILSCWHPDIEEFITAKLSEGRLSKFNISVDCPNVFMDQVIRVKTLIAEGVSKDIIEEQDKWNLIFPDTRYIKYREEWTGDIYQWQSKGYPVIIYKTVSCLALWDMIMKSTYTRNDPGVLFLDIANKTHCWNYGGDVSHIAACNPCLTLDTTIITPLGTKKFGELKIGDQIWSSSGWTAVINKWSTGIKDVFKYKTTAGSFIGTGNHKIVSCGEKIDVDDAESIDVISGPLPSIVNHDVQDIMDGLVIGDGTKNHSSGKKILLCIGSKDYDYFNSEIKNLILGQYLCDPYEHYITTTITKEELPPTYERDIPDRFFYASQSKICGFLRGLFSANGSMCGDRVTLKASSLKLIEKVQIMLSSVGIRSYVTINKPSMISFRNGDYLCKQSYDLNISSDRQKFYNIIGFIQQYKKQSLEASFTSIGCHRKNSYEIISKEFIGKQEVFDITVDNDTHTFWNNGLNVSNCRRTNAAIWCSM